MTTTAWEKGTSRIVDTDVSDLAAAMCPTWRPENPQDLIEKLCILKSVIAHSGVTGFPEHAADCFCEYRDMDDEYWQDSGDIFRFIAQAIRDRLQVRASYRCHPVEAKGKVLASNGLPIVAVMFDADGWSVLTSNGWTPAEGPAQDPESQWVEVAES